MVPVSTICRTTLRPLFLNTYENPLSVTTASSGTERTFGRDAVSIAFDVVMPGRRVVSGVAISILTSKTLESWLGRCSPTLAMWVTVPASFLEGSASREICTFWPRASFRTSTSFT